MSGFNMISEIKGVSSAKGAISRALNYVKNASKLPSFLGSDVTDKIALAATDMGYNTQQFQKPLFKAIRVLNLPKDIVDSEMNLAIDKEVVKHCASLTDSQEQLISDVQFSGEVKLKMMQEAYKVLQADFKAMLKYQGISKVQLFAQLKKAGIILPQFESTKVETIKGEIETVTAD